MNMTPAPTIGLGVLSWRGYDSLRATLSSYRDQDLFSLFDQTLVFLPEIEEEGRALVAGFGLEVAGHPQNLGILGGFQALAQVMRTDYILLCENDFALLEPLPVAGPQIRRGLVALDRGDAVVWRFRHLMHPGEPNQMAKVKRYWPTQEDDRVEQLLALGRRIVRPDKARKFIGHASCYRLDMARRFPDLVRVTVDGDYLVRSDVMPWSNNPFLINRHFYLDTVVTAALDHPTTRTINGFPTIETELNRGWWRAQKFWVGVSNPGVFTHSRKGDRGY